MNKLTLNQKQLELFTQPQTYIMLAHFAVPRTPSEAAKHMVLPANTVHYHVNKLLNVGLLECVGETGRSKTYKTIATQFRVAEADLPAFDQNLPKHMSATLKKLERGFTQALDLHCLKGSSLPKDPDNAGFYMLDLYDDFSVSPFEPSLNLLEVSLSQRQYERFSQKLGALLNEVKDSVEEGEMCTFALISFPGRAVSRS